MATKSQRKETGRTLVGKCPFCSVPGKENAVFEITVERPVKNHGEGLYHGKNVTTTDYICGIGRQNCTIVESYRRANHRHSEPSLPLDIARF